jgi:OOP family OmpA-OmpF porin
MKKTFTGLSIISVSILSANINISALLSKTNVFHSPIKHYYSTGIRIKDNYNNLFTGIELQASKKFQQKKLFQYQIIQGFEYPTDTDFRPYIYLGLGYQTITHYKNSWISSLGIGSKYAVSDTFKLFLEIRTLRDFNNNDYQFGGQFGINYSFDNSPQIETLNSLPITDTKEENRSNQMVIKPKPQIHKNVIKSSKPQNHKKNYVLTDTDNDGVPDYLDKCIHTPKGVKVDKNGCPVSFRFDITFKENSYKIEPKYIPEIKKFADFLKQHPGYIAEIEGYTDNLGSPLYNKVLSLKRAKAVYEALIKQGVDKKRLKFAGYGAENPIAPNTTPQGRAKNRRVVAKIFF